MRTFLVLLIASLLLLPTLQTAVLRQLEEEHKLTVKYKLVIHSEANFEEKASDDPPENGAGKTEIPISDNKGDDDGHESGGKYGNCI